MTYSEIYVLNKLSNIIERISYNKLDEKIHKTIDDKLLEKLSKKNISSIKKVIKSQESYSKKYYHTSTTIFPYPIEDKYTDNSSWLGKGLYKNPRGIWIGCGTSWYKFITDKPNPWSLGTYLYEVEISDSVMRISSLQEFKSFINKYKKEEPKINDVINWKKVKKEYDGLVICPYLGNIIWGKKANTYGLWGESEYFDDLIKNKFHKLSEWYRHWEEGSGVIWRPSTGLQKISLIKKLNTFDKI